jgi:LacI family transcriptional regulator
MDPHRPGKWEGMALQVLIRRLRRTVEAAPGSEEKLWNELLRRLEQSENPLTVKDAVSLMGLTRNPESANQIASRLRGKLRKASRTIEPDPGVYLSEQTYAIRMSENPPDGWTQSTGPSIGLLLADASDIFVGDLIRGVIEVCEKHAFDLMVDVSGDDPVSEAKKLQHLLERTQGVLVVPVSDATLDPTTRELLRDRECVLVDRYLRDLPDVPCIHHDDISAGRKAGIYLKECSCARVLIVDQGSRSPNDLVITPLQDRTKGCQIQLRDQLKVRHLRAAGSDEQGGFDALKQFERSDKLADLDGIFALTDRLAVGCRHYLATRQPPLDLPVIGTEGQPFGDFVIPPLVSIGFDTGALGKLAATVLFAKLQEGELPQSDCKPHYLIPPVLLEPSATSGARHRIPISFQDAPFYYSSPK